MLSRAQGGLCEGFTRPEPLHLPVGPANQPSGVPMTLPAPENAPAPYPCARTGLSFTASRWIGISPFLAVFAVAGTVVCA